MSENEDTQQGKEDPTELLEPSAQTHIVRFGKGPDEQIYSQRPLSFFGKMDFFAVMGGALESAMSGPNGIGLDDIPDVIPENAADLKDADSFLRAVAKVASYAPEILLDLYCVILAVPRGEREYVKHVMELPEEDGGLSDDQGIEVFRVFIDQNWDVMADFFTRKLGALGKELSERVGLGSRSSKRSKSTRRSTPKVSRS